MGRPHLNGVNRDGVGQPAWRADFHAVVKSKDPHGCSDRVVAVCQGIDQQLAQRLRRQFGEDFRLKVADTVRCC